MKITVYSKPNCMACAMTKKYLKENNVQFESIDVTQNEEALQIVKDLGFQSMPVAVVKGFKPFFGFRPETLDKIIVSYFEESYRGARDEN